MSARQPECLISETNQRIDIVHLTTTCNEKGMLR